MHEVRLVDSLNQVAYNSRYKNLDTLQHVALRAYRQSNLYKQGKAEACNYLGFYAFMQMDFEGAERYYKEVFSITSNELECLVADIGLMKVYQRTSMNKEFFDYRNSAVNRMKRINEDIAVFAESHEKLRLNYAFSEFHIVSAIYYYYLQQQPEANEEINLVEYDDRLAADTAQWLYYHYIKGSAALCENDEPESLTVCQFDNLYISWRQSLRGDYIYFEANCLQGIAELLISDLASEILYDRRSQALRMLNPENHPDSLLPFYLAQKALQKFKEYDDIYQVAGAYRTIGTWLNKRGYYEQALDSLTKALDQVNKHHELYYQCLDTLDRLKPYAPIEMAAIELFTGDELEKDSSVKEYVMDESSDLSVKLTEQEQEKEPAFIPIELHWIVGDKVKTVPEWIARIREQLSVTFAGLENKEASDYNRNIYLDILDYTRQDKELESRYMALKREARELNLVMLFVVLGIVLLIPLFWIFNKRWERRNQEDIYRLRKTLEICQVITASLPSEANESEEIVESITTSVLTELESLFPINRMQISLENGDEKEEIRNETQDALQESSPKEIKYEFELTVPDKEQSIGVIDIYSLQALSKEDIALIKIIVPYIAWVIENGLTFISLGDERRRLEKQLYVYEQHIVENKRQNVIKRACMSIVTGLNPFIDRIINEISKLREKEYTRDEQIRKEKYQYIDELITKINEYNDILALWIKMKQGTLSLNIENFQLNDLFEVISKGRKTFEMKNQAFTITPVNAMVKADKALTLFMLNTLTENARKYTPAGGKISVYAEERDNYVEISVEDTGRGLSEEDIALILKEKIYDSGQIGTGYGEDIEELKNNKGSGFGLMNCKGIIEKYRKTNEIFHVCLFGIEGKSSKGSRFFFRLPKGVRKTVGVLLFVLASAFTVSCESYVGENSEVLSVEMREFTDGGEREEFYRLLTEADHFADTAYYCNLIGEYAFALQYIDSSMARLNEHYMRFAAYPYDYMTLTGMGRAAEIDWWNERFDSDFHIILDIRNEAAVAFLSLKDWEAYSYNNRAYTELYKLLGEDTSLAEYCRRLEHSTNNKIVGIILCIMILGVLLIGYYIYYIRRRFVNRRNLEEVLDINQEVFSASLLRLTEEDDKLLIPRKIIEEIFDTVNELLIIEALGIGVYNEDNRKLEYVFNPNEFEEQETMTGFMGKCFETEAYTASSDSVYQCFPLIVDVSGNRRCIGVLGLIKQLDIRRESDGILSELIARFIAIVVFNAVVKLAVKYRDIESAQDEANRASREDSLIHVQNMVLDNCLSTIKHETVYYPNKIKQIVDKLNTLTLSRREEEDNLDTIHELISYYKDIYTILSSCASRQLEEVTFRRSSIPVLELADYIKKYFQKQKKRFTFDLELKVAYCPGCVVGDRILLKLLLENLVDEAFTYPEGGIIDFQVTEDDGFIRFDFIDRRREKSVTELNQLFYPHLSKLSLTENGRLTGVEYLICKQIIRDHDEFAGRRGCRINAEPAAGGGFTVYFTIPKR